MKEKIGRHIQELRTEKGLSRQALCGLEEELTVRHLQRIEKGISMPSLETAVYIAQELEISIDDLVGQQSLALPKGYLELKHQIINLPAYGNKERLERLEELLDEIYTSYFDDLPEEEQLWIQIKQAKVNLILMKHSGFGQGLMADYWEDIKKKKRLSALDLELIDIRLAVIAIDGFDKEEVVFLLQKVLLAPSYMTLESYPDISRTLVIICGILSDFHEYDLFPDILGVLEDITIKLRNHETKVFIYAIKWKMALFLEGNVAQAVDYFSAAQQLTELLSEEVMGANMNMEWQEDLDYFKQSSNKK